MTIHIINVVYSNTTPLCYLSIAILTLTVHAAAHLHFTYFDMLCTILMMTEYVAGVPPPNLNPAIFLRPVWGQTTKRKDHQYFQLYGTIIC